MISEASKSLFARTILSHAWCAGAGAMIALSILACNRVGLMPVSAGDHFASGFSLAPGLALAAMLKWRATAFLPVLVGATLGFAATGHPYPLTEGTLIALSAAFAARAMRYLHRRGYTRTNQQRWATMFAAGACGFAVLHATGDLAMLTIDRVAVVPDIAAILHQATSDLLAILLVMAVVASLGDLRLGFGIWRRSSGLMLSAAAALVALSGSLGVLPADMIPDTYLLLSLPIALWIARQPVSLPGATVTLVANCAGLALVAALTGSVQSPALQQTMFFLLALTINAQIVHMLEKDRQGEIAETARHRQAVRDIIFLATRTMPEAAAASRPAAAERPLLLLTRQLA